MALKGGQGTLWRVFEVIDGLVCKERAYALKVMYPGIPVKYFDREEAALRHVKSSFVCHLVDTCRAQQIIVMNWVDGCNLYQIEEHTRYFEFGNIIYHRLDGQPIKVTICDLGCARENDGVDLSDVGTPLFKPLNAKVMGQNVYTEKRDILGLGKTMYFIMFHDYYRDYPRQIAIDTSRYKLTKSRDNKEEVFATKEDEEEACFPYSPELLEIISRMLNEDDLPSAETLLKTEYIHAYADFECELMKDSIEQKLWSQRLAEWKKDVVDWGSPHIKEDYENKRIYMNTTSQDFTDPDQIYQVPPSVFKDPSEIKTLFEDLTTHHP
ncbi:hypothetical protein BLNAU_1255 [Blattamonas nauphoetae]|uniref:Protein kinase domain-containing protein n=1 Tax=Blattamonas nauphoetae TaxID=2049346 RepID=A0ABQ9YIY5_9EUKA|nr:hypothetical protein BLNAU_1255 [Blattamonas nauphoetae]